MIRQRNPFAARRALLRAATGALAMRASHAWAAQDAQTVLTVSGRMLTGGRVDFDMAALARMAQHKIVTETPWYKSAREFTGPLLRDVLAAAGLPANAPGTAQLIALNDYKVDLPLADAQQYDVIVARLLDGKPMTVREKGPLFIMYPFAAQPQLRTAIYLGRCVWQLRAIELT